MPITLDGTLGITTPSYGGADAAEYLVPVTAFKNRIINGGMVLDQRNSGASVTVTNTGTTTYTLDRWFGFGTIASRFSVQQNAGSVTPPTGFTNYLGVTSLSAYSVLTGDNFQVTQRIEGFNTADLNWGTASAQTVTISFWVRSSLTGTFGGSLRNDSSTRSYPFSYTISSANTWEQKTITVAGDTTGTWLTNNNVGIGLTFNLGSGSFFSGTAGVWANGDLRSSTGATSVVGTNGATWYVTGVQFEVGTNATFFDARPYPTELQLCQRYYEKYSGQFTRVAISYGNNSGRVSGNITWKVTKRTSPTLEISATNAFRVNDAAANRTSTNLLINPNGDLTQIASLITDVASGITTGAIYDVDIGASNGWFAANSEL